MNWFQIRKWTETFLSKMNEFSNQPFSTVQHFQRYEAQYVANMREKPGKENELIIASKAGSPVYLVETAERQADDLHWWHVKTEDDKRTITTRMASHPTM